MVLHLISELPPIWWDGDSAGLGILQYIHVIKAAEYQKLYLGIPQIMGVSPSSQLYLFYTIRNILSAYLRRDKPQQQPAYSIIHPQQQHII